MEVWGGGRMLFLSPTKLLGGEGGGAGPPVPTPMILRVNRFKVLDYGL